MPLLEDRGRVRVRGAEDELPALEVGQPIREPGADPIEDGPVDGHQVAGDEDGLPVRVKAFRRFTLRLKCLACVEWRVAP